MEQKYYWIIGIIVILGVLVISGCVQQLLTQSQNYCGDGTCQSDETSFSCPEDCPVTHNECVNQQCAEVEGEGQDQCTTDADCTVATHLECINEQCIEVQGAGADQCQEDNDCITCDNECPQEGLKQCSGNGYRTCGNYDSDSCLEWSSVTACPEETTCQNGECKEQDSDGLIIDSGSNLNEQIIKEYMIWDLPELSGFIYGGEWGQLSDYLYISLRYRSPEDNDQHSEFGLNIYDEILQDSFLDNEVTRQSLWDISMKDINGNKIFEGTSEIPIGTQRTVLWISGNNFIRSWNGNDMGTVIDDILFDILIEAYLEKYPSTY